MRAHMNCVENLPIYTALLVALMGTGLQSAIIDDLTIAPLSARICQTLTHVVLPSTNAATALFFSLHRQRA
jgi:MAPEG family protein